MTRRALSILTLFAFALLTLATLAPRAAEADETDAWQEQQDRVAADNFDEIMLQNSMLQQAASAPSAPARAGHAARTAPVSGGMIAAPVDPAQVELSLDAYARLLDAVEAATASAGAPTTPVVLGASRFTGESRDGVLHLQLELQVTLASDAAWKVVPLVGEQVVVQSARSGGQALGLSRMSGYHVWITREGGEHTLTLDLLVPPRGRRGSLEYDFQVARTPATTFSCSFPSADLEPRLRAAVQSSVARAGDRTTLSATLEPTSRVHLVGFRDLGASGAREARLYAEGLHLVSLSAGTLELFSVARYNILYAGNRSFDLMIPEGFDVVSAEGEGAFRYTLEDRDGATLLKGETAYPIRNSYEISLRLKRDIPEDGSPFTVSLPRTVGAEREYGWVGAEVTGTLKLDEVERAEALAVDVRQLPLEMVQSAVSPVLRAWRYHASDARIVLSAERLPEQDPASASIDTVVADTVVSAAGRRLTDVRITLRNRIRHSLAVRLPPGAEVRSTLLDGEPIKPSRSRDGALLFPLKRSDGATGLEPFTLQLVLEEDAPPPGLAGRLDLALPTLELPVSTLRWRAWLPKNNDYSALEGDIEPQQVWGAGRWYRAPQTVGIGGLVGAGTGPTGGAARESSESGAMPVRIDLPRSGQSLELSRYWLEADQPIEGSTWHVRSWLKGPAAVLCGIAVVLVFALLGPMWMAAPTSDRRRLGALAASGLMVAGLGMAVTASASALVLAAAVGVGALSTRTGLHQQLRPALSGAWARARTASAPAADGRWKQRSLLGRVALIGAWAFALFLLGICALRLLFVLPNPLG